MNRRNLIAVLTCSFFVLAIVVLLISSGLSQSTEAGKLASDNKIDSAKQTSHTSLQAAQEGDSSTGWLILNGKLIPGPYTFSVRGDTLLINDIPAIYRSRRMRPDGSEPYKPSPNANDQHRLNVEFHDTIEVWYNRKGFDSAKQYGVNFLNGSPLVDSARIDSCGDVMVKFVGKPFEETFYMYPFLQQLRDNTEYEYDTSLAMIQRGRENRAAYFEKRLNQGDLLIITDHIVKSYPAGRARAKLLEIKRIVESLPDLAERQQALRKILPGDRMAKAIAENFDR